MVFDAQFQKLNVIRGDRSNGLYLRNFTAERSTFNAVYVLEVDGFVIDKLVGRWNTEYGFLSFAAEHGLFIRCEAYGNGRNMATRTFACLQCARTAPDDRLSA